MMFMAKAIAAGLSAALLTAAAPYLSPLGQEVLGNAVTVVVTMVLGGGITGALTFLVPNKPKK
jgi:hypothetical protein